MPRDYEDSIDHAAEQSYWDWQEYVAWCESIVDENNDFPLEPNEDS